MPAFRFLPGNSYQTSEATARRYGRTVITIKSVTHSSVTTENGKRFKIYRGPDGGEFVYYDGKYSMCPIIGADERVA